MYADGVSSAEILDLTWILFIQSDNESQDLPPTLGTPYVRGILHVCRLETLGKTIPSSSTCCRLLLGADGWQVESKVLHEFFSS